MFQGEKAGDDDSSIILTDILGLEDALGSMDLKVTGSTTGMTAFQLDVKGSCCSDTLAGLPLTVLQKAFMQVTACT